MVERAPTTFGNDEWDGGGWDAVPFVLGCDEKWLYNYKVLRKCLSHNFDYAMYNLSRKFREL